MNRLRLLFALITSLTFVHLSAAQSGTFMNERWHTAGAGLSTPLGFNVGASYSFSLKGPLFFQASASATKDIYVTKHSTVAVGPALGLRAYNEFALTSISVGPTYTFGSRGLDLSDPGIYYAQPGVNVIGQILFRDLHMGFEIYTNMNPVRNVSGMRLIYRLGNIR